MKVPVALVMLFASQFAHADIATRVAAARAFEPSSSASQYNMGVMLNSLLPLMKRCAPPGTPTDTTDWVLTLVGTVSAKGRISDIEVDPANAITACVAEHMKKARLAKPPASSTRSKVFPLLVELKMTDSAKKAQPRNVGAVTPVFGQIVAYSYPDNFKPAFENSYAGAYIQELVPQGESVEQWSQMITLTGARDQALNAAATPMDFAGQLASRFSKACPGTFSSKVLGNPKIAGHDAFVALLGCGTVQSGTPRSEVTMIATIKGKSDMYTIQWAERSAPANQAPSLDNTKWAGRFQQLNPIKVCDRVAGEAAPYPSCIGGPVTQ